jgi:signal transduction histidine kinase
MPGLEDTSFARLVSLACHDLRTPLATVHGFARTLRQQDLGEPATRYVEMITAASEQMTELLEELGLVARVEDGRYEPTLQVVDTLGLAHTAAGPLGDGVVVSGRGGSVETDPDAAARALAALARAAMRHGAVDRIDLRVDGADLALSPVIPEAAAIVLGQELRDFGAACAGRVIEGLGGSLSLEGETLHVRLPRASEA